MSMRNPQSWGRVFFNMAFAMAERSKDPSTQCGAVLVDKHNVVISTGFNGPPPQLEDAMVPWTTRPQKYAYIIHAEENALMFGLEYHGGKRLIESNLYCTHKPCADCILRLIRFGVKNVMFPKDTNYPLSKYQVESHEIISVQMYPKINLIEVNLTIGAKVDNEKLVKEDY